MENLYTIAIETNDMGWNKSDKAFVTSKLANAYMRKMIARHIWFLRRQNINISKLVIYKDNNNTNIIVLIYENTDGVRVYNEYRVRDLIMYQTEKDFEQYPIQF